MPRRIRELMNLSFALSRFGSCSPLGRPGGLTSVDPMLPMPDYCKRPNAHPSRMTARLRFLVAAASIAASTHALAQLTVVCNMQAEWCNAAATEFEKETGIKVAMTLKGSGESFAQIAAERANPKLDLWFGGTGDPHLQAAELGLLEEYRSPLISQLEPWAQKQAEQSKYRTVGVYLGILGIGYNAEFFAKRKLAPPACWRELVKAEEQGEV